MRNSLNVHHTNFRSILNKIDLFRGIACVESFDIIALDWFFNWVVDEC